VTHRKHRPLVGQPQTPLRIRLTFCANQLRGNPLSGVDADVDVAVRGLRDPAGQREQAAADARERAEGRGQHDHRDQSLRHGARVGVGPVASAVGSPRRLGRPPGARTDPAGHGDRARSRPPAR